MDKIKTCLLSQRFIYVQKILSITFFLSASIVSLLLLVSCTTQPETNTAPTSILENEATETELLLPDLKVINAQLRINSKDICADPENTAMVFIQIQNQGNANADYFTVEINNAWQSVPKGLLQGQIANIWFPLSKEVLIKVDVNQEIREINEDNNQAFYRFSIPTLAPSCLITPSPPVKVMNPEFTFTGHTGKVLTISFSPDGKLITSGSIDNSMRFWMVNEKKLLRTMENHPFPILSLAYSPNGIYLATSSTDGLVRLWRVSNGQLIHKLSGHTGWVRTLAISPDGKFIASGGDDYTVRIWRITDGKLTQTIDEGMAEIQDISFSPDSESLAWAESDGTIRVRSLNGRWLNKFNSANNSATSIAFSLDGKYLISGNKNGSVLVWQLENGLLQQNFMAHNALITDVAISKDGTLLATASTDRTIKLWEISNGHVEIFPLTSYVGHEAPVTSVSFQPTGEYLASGSEDTTIRLWFIPVASVP